MRIIVYENVSGSLYVRTDAWHANATEARYSVSINPRWLRYIRKVTRKRKANNDS